MKIIKSILNKLFPVEKYPPSSFRYFGIGAFVSENARISKPGRIILSDYSHIPDGALINSNGGLYIGKYSGLGFNCTIFTTEHNFRMSKSIPFDDLAYLKPVIIRDFVWIGSDVKILPGKEIGEGAIAGMGAVITKDVPPLAIVLGNPAEIIGYRDKDHFISCKNDLLFCPPRRGEAYKEVLYPYHRRKFNNELRQIGLID